MPLADDNGGPHLAHDTESEEVAAEYKNPIATIVSRAGVPKVRHETLQNELGEKYAEISGDYFRGSRQPDQKQS